MYVVGFLKIHDRWEGSKKIGGILSRGKNRTNINPKDYSKRLLTYMVNSVPKHRWIDGTRILVATRVVGVGVVLRSTRDAHQEHISQK